VSLFTQKELNLLNREYTHLSIFFEAVKEIVGYLLNEGIPEDAWDISELVDDENGGAEYKKPDFSSGISVNVKFDSKKFNQMIQQVCEFNI